jgi:hypothetical protein
MYYTLVARTHKGKNKLQEVKEKCGLIKVEHNRWKELDRINTVQFSDKTGPWVKIIPIGIDSLMRWVHLSDDEDFEVIQVTDI